MAGIGASFNALVKRQTSFVRSAADELDAAGAEVVPQVQRMWTLIGSCMGEERKRK